MSKKHVIYCHTNLSNGFKYIGQAYGDPKQRWQNGRGYTYKKLNKRGFGQAILNYGWNNFSHEILEQNLSQEEANDRERYWIKYYHTWVEDSNCKGYNLTQGGGVVEGSSEPLVSITFRLPDEMKEELERIAKKEDRSLSYVVTKAIKYYINGCQPVEYTEE